MKIYELDSQTSQYSNEYVSKKKYVNINIKQLRCEKMM